MTGSLSFLRKQESISVIPAPPIVILRLLLNRRISEVPNDKESRHSCESRNPFHQNAEYPLFRSHSPQSLCSFLASRKNQRNAPASCVVLRIPLHWGVVSAREGDKSHLTRLIPHYSTMLRQHKAGERENAVPNRLLCPQ